MTLDLAKPCVDVGLFTNRLDDSMAFWRDGLGLPYEEALPTGGGVLQHRLGLNGSVLKVNHARDELGDGPTPYRRLVIATDGPARSLIDPDGLPVELVPKGTDGIEAIEIVYGVADPDAHARFLGDVIGAERLDGAATRFRLATTCFRIEHDPTAQRASVPMRTRGFRYTTIQVRDCDASHAALVAAGADEGMPPRTLGDVARISFIRDPAGGWIEISQRASLVGSLG